MSAKSRDAQVSCTTREFEQLDASNGPMLGLLVSLK